ncbi:MAG: TatD family nuclease-associated radical SAM protein [Candidatus Bathyarchaeia archaeon]
MPRGKGPSIVYWLGNNLYLNITNRCPNNCYFCLRNFKSGVGGFKLKLQREPCVDEIIGELQKFINLKSWAEFVFCGFGEPLERLDCILEVCRWIRRHYGKTISIRVDTNGQGYLINNGRDVIKELRNSGVNRLSVSLNAHDQETYNEVCRPTFKNAFESVIEFIGKAKGNFDVEITAVAIPEVDLSKIGEIARKFGVKFRVREYIPCSW